MVLRMARPTTRPGSKSAQFRRRIPGDVLERLRAKPDWQRRGWSLSAGEITLSLTKEAWPGETITATQARLLSEAETIFAAFRQPLRTLSHEEVAALAGEVYCLIASPAPDAPKNRNTTGSDVLERLVESKGIRLEAASMNDLWDAVFGERGAVADALALEAERRDGSSMAPLKAFPEWSAPKLAPAVVPHGKPLKVSDLVARYREAATVKPSVVRRYRPVFEAFIAYLKDPLAATVTAQDIRRFREERTTSERSESTVRKVDMSAIKSLFAWATDAERHDPPLLAHNPAAEVRIGKKGAARAEQGQRRRRFYEEEWSAILKAALAVRTEETAGNLDKANALKWAPWIAAYTGARIASITGLATEDCHRDGGIWFLKFPPAKGFRTSRDVPIHEHLIELGLVEFIRSKPSGPLFYSATGRRKPDAASSPAERRGADVAHWVRTTVGVTGKEAAPNHAWRHTFKTRALDAGIDARIADAICGHSSGSRTPARLYENITLRMKAEALAKFPRYSLGGSIPHG